MRKTKKVLAMILSLVLCCSLCVSTVHAEGGEPFSGDTSYSGEEIDVVPDSSEETNVVPDSSEETNVVPDNSEETNVVPDSSEETNVVPDNSEEVVIEPELEIIIDNTEEIEEEEPQEDDSADLRWTREPGNGNGVEINETNFPDDNFREYVSGWEINTTEDDVLTESEISAVDYIDVGGYDISDLSGIEFFTSLEELYCPDNQLTSLDLSNNKSLEELSCENNLLTALDLSENTLLQNLYCYNNQLTSLDLSHNSELEVVDCYNNDLSELNVVSNTALIDLECSENQLKSIDLSKNESLHFLACYSNQFRFLDISNNPELCMLDCSGNRINTIYINNNPELLELYQEGYCIEEDYHDDMETAHYGETGCFVLDLFTVVLPEDIDIDMLNETIIDEESFPDAVFREYVSENFDLNEDGYLDKEEIRLISKVDCYNCSVKDLTGIEFFGALVYLYCQDNELTSLNLRNNTVLQELDCSYNRINSLDLSNKPKLIYSLCFNNELTSLDVSNDTLLEKLYCYDNKLETLDLKTNTELKFLDCDDNKLETLDLKTNTELKFLDCGSNQLTGLDVKNCTKLTDLKCGNNEISTLDVSRNTELRHLGCSINQLSSLDVSNNKNLDTLWCATNELKELDVKNNKMLTRLNCGMNELTGIDVSRNELLEKLECYANNISVLDLSENANLQNLNCSSNPVSSLDVANNTKLSGLYCHNNQLRSLDVSNNNQLNLLYCFGNPIKVLDIRNNAILANIFLNGERTEYSSSSDDYYLYQIGDEFDENKLAVWTQTEVVVNDESDVEINEEHFPDGNFRKYITETADLDKNGFLSKNEIYRVEGMDLAGKEIRNLKGLELFVALENLNCERNFVTSIDIRTIPRLVEIHRKGVKQTIEEGGSLITVIQLKRKQGGDAYDVFSFDADTEIITIDQEDGVRIDNINFPDKNFRKYVSENYDKNEDGILDPEELKGVTRMDCSSLNIRDLTGIEYFTELTVLNCSYNVMSNLDLSYNTKLEQLLAQGDSLKWVDLANNTALKNLLLFDNELEYLDLQNNIHLEELGYSKIENLDLKKNVELRRIYAYDISEIDLSENQLLDFLYVEGQNLSSLDVSKNKALKELICTNTSLVSLDVSANTALESLNCRENKLNHLVINENIKSLVCNGNNLSELDVSGAVNLNTLGCHNNHITQLDLSHNTNLTSMNCAGNPITDLDLSNNPNLHSLACYNNLFETVDISNNPFIIQAYTEGKRTVEEDYVMYAKNGVAYFLVDPNMTVITESSAHRHTLVHTAAKAATCTEAGNIEYWYCEGCDSYFSDKDAKTEIEKDSIIIKALGHRWDDGVITKEATTKEEGIKTYTCEVCHKTRTEKIPKKKDVTEEFNDVPKTAWYVAAVQYVFDSGIMSGKGKSFEPNASLTREQFTQVLYNHQGQPEVTYSYSYTDVRDGQWYTRSVYWAKKNNIANGKGDNFGIGQSITREEMALMLYKYAKLENFNTDRTQGIIEGYADTSAVSSWSKEAMEWAISQGIMGGKAPSKDSPKSETRIDPQGKATRAECASMIKKMLEKNGK